MLSGFKWILFVFLICSYMLFTLYKAVKDDDNYNY